MKFVLYTSAVVAICGGFYFVSYFVLPSVLQSVHLQAGGAVHLSPTAVVPEIPEVTHLKTPPIVRAVYMTSWVGGTKHLRASIESLIDETELNALVLDIKDYSGAVAFKLDEPRLLPFATFENRIPDIKEFIRTLHEKNVYVIGRIAVFQDPLLVAKRPELAVKRSSDHEAVWKDRKGLPWLDPGAREVWHYIALLSKAAYGIGFDEINLDYIRFPSDGNIADIFYPMSEGKVKVDIIEEFFSTLSTELRDSAIPISADLFGQTATSDTDMNIGQVLERAMPYFDVIAPMVYPSHYGVGLFGFENPADHPYEVVKQSMQSAIERAVQASSSAAQLRPWLQDFDLGATYTPSMVRSQIQALYDVGVTSWMLWSPSNRYSREALKEAPSAI